MKVQFWPRFPWLWFNWAEREREDFNVCFRKSRLWCEVKRKQLLTKPQQLIETIWRRNLRLDLNWVEGFRDMNASLRLRHEHVVFSQLFYVFSESQAWNIRRSKVRWENAKKSSSRCSEREFTNHCEIISSPFLLIMRKARGNIKLNSIH